ncbi:MAG: TonB-dependent receptor, partial [Candidatus Neomarinimicrobiota bacterium]
QYTSFQGWNTVSAQTLADGDQATNLSPSAAQKVFRYEHRKQGDIIQPDYNIDFGFGGPVPFVSRALGNLRFYASYRGIQTPYVFRTNRDALTDNSLMLKVTSNLSPAMKLTFLSLTGQTYATSATGFGNEPGGTGYFNSVGGVVSTIDRIGHTLSWRLYTNDYWARTQVNSSTLSAQLNHLLSDRSYYNLIVKRTAKRYETGPGPARDDTTLFEIVPGYFVNKQAPFGWESSPVFALGDGMGMGGSVSTARDSSSHTSTTVDFNYVKQVSAHHELSTGVQLTYDQFDLKFGSINLALPLGNTWTEFQRNPYRLVTYFEDKIETDGYVALLGLTLDYVDPNGDWISLANPYDTDFGSNAYDPERADEFEYEPAEANFYVSPRLGIAHPITENSKLYFNYGHYLAMPQSDRLYREQRGDGFVLDRLGDPSLPLERTIAYELGFDQALGAGLLLHLAAYYKDITHQQSWTRYINIGYDVNYRQLTDKNYGDIRGLEIDLSKNLGRWLTGNVNFEYRVSTSGYFDLPPVGGITYLYQNPADQRQYLRDRHSDQSRPLPRPRFKSNLALHTPAEFGPGRLGEALLGGWLLNFIGRWTDGARFTWNPNNIPGQTNNLRWNPFVGLDLKASKSIELGNLRATFFVDVNNVLNIRNFSIGGSTSSPGDAFYNAFDYNDYMYSLHLPKDVISKLGTNYTGIAGDDRPGDVRDTGVAFVPIEWVASADYLPTTEPLIEADRELYYYVSDTEQYMAWDTDGWVEADSDAIQKVLDTRAYIDMPNHTYFTFLNPRFVFFGLTLTFDFN